MTFSFSVGKIKDTAGTRYDFGVKVKDQAPKSDIYKQHPEVKASADALVVDNDTLKDAKDKFTAAEAIFKKARTALLAATAKWDASFDYYLANGQKFCSSEDDGASLALGTRNRAAHPLAAPISVEAEQDFKRSLLRIHVTRAPGMTKVRVQISRDGGATWIELEGHGAVQKIPNPAPGVYTIRAASETANAKSEFTAPITVTVK